MAKFDEQSINKFIGSLEEIDESWQTEFNLREVVKKSYPLIKKAKKYKVSWEKIAKILEESCEGKVSISPVTIRQYYLELSKRSKKSKKSLKDSKTSKAASTEAVKEAENIVSDSAGNEKDKTPKLEKFKPGSFNLRGN